MLQTFRTEKVVEKNEVICLVSRFPSWVIVLQLSEKCFFFFFEFCALTYIYLKYLVTNFLKMVLFIMLWLTATEILGFQVQDFVKFLLTQHFLIFLIDNNGGSDTHIIFWKSIMRTSKCSYVNCFNRLRFLAEISTKLQKIHFFSTT